MQSAIIIKSFSGIKDIFKSCKLKRLQFSCVPKYKNGAPFDKGCLCQFDEVLLYEARLLDNPTCLVDLDLILAIIKIIATAARVKETIRRAVIFTED